MKFYVYLITNKAKTVLYTGVTNNLEHRIWEHYTGKNSFTSKYKVYFLLYYETFQYINDAIAREKEVKGWKRERKESLIKEFNHEFQFLNEELYGEWPPKGIGSRLE